MDRQQVLLAKTLEAAHVPLNIKTFDDRLILQKAVYLLQSAGIHLGFCFRWYLRGPYSSDMTAGVCGILDEGDYGAQALAGWKLDEESAKRARNLHSLLHREGEDTADKARRLELLASSLFLFRTEQAQPGDAEGTSRILKANNKSYDADEVRAAVTDLRAHGLA